MANTITFFRIAVSIVLFFCPVFSPAFYVFYIAARLFYPDTEYVNQLMTHSWGQRVVRFFDPDGILIEVGTPV